MVANFAAYDNTLAVLVANEIMQADLTAAACVKQYVADLKSWMRVNGKKIRLIPLAYAAADSSYAGKIDNADVYHVLKIQGLLCGDQMVDGAMLKSIDIYLINEYRWCPQSTYAESYERFLNMAKGLPIPIAFGEYGCKLSKSTPRDWGMVSFLYDAPSQTQSFSATFSGGLAYSFGLAKLSTDSLFPMFTGGSSEITGVPSDIPTVDYANLKKSFASHNSYKEVGLWSSDNVCSWSPPIDSKIDPSNSRAMSDGWIPSSCSSKNLIVASTDTWRTPSREGVVCTDDGKTCDVSIFKAFDTTQQSICGSYSVQSGGTLCNSSAACGTKGQCIRSNGVSSCRCIACYTGTLCNIRDFSSCSSLSSFPAAPKYIFLIAAIFLAIMLSVFITLAIIAHRKSIGTYTNSIYVHSNANALFLAINKLGKELQMRTSDSRRLHVL